MTRVRTTRRHDDAGASLVLAIILVLVIGVMAGAVLSAASTGLRVGSVYSESAAAAQDVDGALKAAVNDVRTSTYAFDAADPKCLPAKGSASADARRVYFTPTPDDVTDGRGQVAVACRPGPTTGTSSGLVTVTCDASRPETCNRPGNAILTLNPPSVTNEPGLEIGGYLSVDGRVFSNSTIELEGSMCPNSPQPPTSKKCVELYSSVPDFPVFARGKCMENGRTVAVAPAVPPVSGQPHVFSTPAARCSYGATPNPYGDDPGLPQPSTASLALQTVAACTAGSRTLTLSPGYYDDAAALSDWTDGGCSGNKTVVLSPGTYFFDFKNGEMAPGVSAPAVPRGSNVWNVSGSNVSLIAGTDPDGRAVSGPIAPGRMPGVCDNPLDDPAARGVTMVFGGDSRIVYQSGHVELCGTGSRTSSPVVVYGATASSANLAPVDSNDRVGTGSATPSPAPDQTFSPAPSRSGATVVSVLADRDESGGRRVATVDIARDSRRTRTASFKLTGFAPASALPKGAILTSAALTVRHQEQNTRTQTVDRVTTPLDTLSVTVTPDGGTALAPVTVPVFTQTSSSTYTDTRLELADKLMTQVHDKGLTGLSVELDATAATGTGGAKWTVNVDEVSLDLTYRLPSVRAQTSQYLGTATSPTNATTVRLTNCMALVNGPYQPGGGGDEEGSGASGCALMSVTSAGHADNSKIVGEFYVQGSVYAPGAAVELILPHQNASAIRSGLIARSVRVNVPGGSDEGDSSASQPISITVPSDSLTTWPLDVYFTAYVCPPGSTCTLPASAGDGSAPDDAAWLRNGWQRGGQAHARYSDEDAFKPVAGRRGVKIVSWQILR